MQGGGPGWFPEQIVVGKRRAGLLRARGGRRRDRQRIYECVPNSGTTFQKPLSKAEVIPLSSETIRLLEEQPERLFEPLAENIHLVTKLEIFIVANELLLLR